MTPLRMVCTEINRRVIFVALAEKKRRAMMFQGVFGELLARKRAGCPQGAGNCTCADQMEEEFFSGVVFVVMGATTLPLEVLLILRILHGRFSVGYDDDLLFSDQDMKILDDILDLERGTGYMPVPSHVDFAASPTHVVVESAATEKTVSSFAVDTRPLWQQWNQHPSGPARGVKLRGAQTRGGRFVG